MVGDFCRFQAVTRCSFTDRRKS